MKWLLIYCLCISIDGAAPQVVAHPAEVDPYSAMVTIILHGQPLSDGLADLQKQVDMGFSLEEPLQVSLSAPEVQGPNLEINLPQVTLAQALDSLCAADGRFDWRQDGQMINIFPRGANTRGSKYGMDRRISHFQLTMARNAGEAVSAALNQLPPPPEPIGFMQLGGSTQFAKPLTASGDDVTLRHAFNIISEQLCHNCGWSISGSKEFYTIVFHASFAKSAEPEPVKRH